MQPSSQWEANTVSPSCPRQWRCCCVLQAILGSQRWVWLAHTCPFVPSTDPREQDQLEGLHGATAESWTGVCTWGQREATSARPGLGGCHVALGTGSPDEVTVGGVPLLNTHPNPRTS